MVRYAVGFSKLPALDDAERAWVQAFNSALESLDLATGLFRTEVSIAAETSQ
jgi:hypothetical protein